MKTGEQTKTSHYPCCLQFSYLSCDWLHRLQEEPIHKESGVHGLQSFTVKSDWKRIYKSHKLMFITAHKPLAVFVAQAVFVVVFPPVFAVVRLIN